MYMEPIVIVIMYRTCLTHAIINKRNLNVLKAEPAGRLGPASRFPEMYLLNYANE